MKRATLFAAVTAVTACSLTTDLDGFSEPIAAVDASDATDGNVPTDAPVDQMPVTCVGIDVAHDTRHCGRCNHDCQGGACAGGVCQPVAIATGVMRPGYLRLDATHVYVVERGGRRIFRVPKSGGALQEVANLDVDLLGLALDATHVYFPAGGIIRRVPLAGGAPQAVVTSTLVVDALVDKGDLFWAEYAASPANGRVHRSDLDGTNDTVLASGYRGVETFARDGDDLFFGENGIDASPGGVYRMPKGGGPIARIGSTPARRLVVDATHVYWLFYHGPSVRRVRRDGSGEEEIARSKNDINLGDIAVDTDSVLWASTVEGVVYRKPKDGGPLEELARVEGPVGVAADEHALYWSAEDGRIYRRVK